MTPPVVAPRTPGTPVALRSRPDRCPGVLRPWPAADGALVRIRLVGGAIPAARLRALADVAARWGDGDLHLTGRANLQLRALPMIDGALPEPVVTAIEATGLLPSRSHELARNLLASPLTGLVGGRADLRPVLAELDRLLCAEPATAALPGRFLFVLDDGRGDLVDRACDLGLVALSPTVVQLRIGATGCGAVVPLGDVAAALMDLATEFLARRGEGQQAAWHVDELPESLEGPLAEPVRRDARSRVSSPPAAYAVHGAHRHVHVPDGRLTPELLDELVGGVVDRVVVTPWHGVVVPVLETGAAR